MLGQGEIIIGREREGAGGLGDVDLALQKIEDRGSLQARDFDLTGGGYRPEGHASLPAELGAVGQGGGKGVGAALLSQGGDVFQFNGNRGRGELDRLFPGIIGEPYRAAGQQQMSEQQAGQFLVSRFRFR